MKIYNILIFLVLLQKLFYYIFPCNDSNLVNVFFYSVLNVYTLNRPHTWWPRNQTTNIFFRNAKLHFILMVVLLTSFRYRLWGKWAPAWYWKIQEKYFKMLLNCINLFLCQCKFRKESWAKPSTLWGSEANILFFIAKI